MTQKYLARVYDLIGSDEVRGFYDAWSDSYDQELTDNAYATPARITEALLNTGTDRDARVLDFGCGTGLSGVPLAAAGFTRIDGTDLSAQMLAVARSKEIYDRLWQAAGDGTVDVPPGRYDVIVATGVIGVGAAPASYLQVLAGLLDTGGRLAFSFNDHALEVPSYPAALAALRDSGAWQDLYEQHGPHLPGIEINSTVYVLEKT